MGKAPRPRPIPREEPQDQNEEAPLREPTTLRPPTFGEDESPSATYKALSESCRAAETHDSIDDELAIEAEIFRVALDRKSQKVPK